MTVLILYVCLILLSVPSAAILPDEVALCDKPSSVVEATLREKDVLPSATTLPLKATLTEESCQRLAYSQEAYKNVGRLIRYENQEDLLLRKEAAYAAAVYLGGQVCATCAHCVNGKPTDVYQVSFEIEQGVFTYYNVDAYSAHPKFNSQTLDNDIALLHLKEMVTGISGLKPAWRLGDADVIRKTTAPLATYIGFGYPYEVAKSHWDHSASMSRCAVQSYVHRFDATHFYSVFYRRIFKRQGNHYLVVKRDPFPYELGIGTGFSGGAVLDQDNNLLGISYAQGEKLLFYPFLVDHLFIQYNFWQEVYKFIYSIFRNPRSYIVLFLKYFLGPNTNVYRNWLLENAGVKEDAAVRVDAYQDWIAEKRLVFEKETHL